MATIQREGAVSALYRLAEQMHDTEGGFAAYDYAKCVWLGKPDRRQRMGGDHPWPTRVHNGEHYVYSVPTFAGVDSENATLLFVGKDNWKDARDPHAWLVAEADIRTGQEHDREIIAVSVEQGRLWMQLAARDNAYNRHDYLKGLLNEQYTMEHAQVWRGRYLEGVFEDYEALEAMIIMVRAIREAQDVAERQRIHQQALGMYGSAACELGVRV